MTHMMKNATPRSLTLLLLVLLLLCLCMLQLQVTKTKGRSTGTTLRVRRKLIVLNDEAAAADVSFPVPNSTIGGQLEPNMPVEVGTASVTEAGNAPGAAPTATATASVEAGGSTATPAGNDTTAAAAATPATATATATATVVATATSGSPAHEDLEAVLLPADANSSRHGGTETRLQPVSSGTAGQEVTPPQAQPIGTTSQEATPPQAQPVSTAGQEATPPRSPQADAPSASSSSSCPRQYSEPLPPDLSGRKFLILAAVREQMSKARLHLSETMALARLLNRTLILPQVAHAADSIRYDHPLPACVYFDVERIGEMVPWVTQSYFLEQVERAEQAGRRISTKTILRHPARESCGRENESWKKRQLPKSLFSRDMEDETA